MIARCADTADVVAAVDIARELGLVVAVRCGGHSVAGLSTCGDGMLIDLSGLESIAVDPETRTARAGGGVLRGEFDAATQAHGIHAPGGRVTTTGLAGFTTGGGYGWTSSKHGLACDNLVSVEHADLFWGIRGGGGNFGIVTEFVPGSTHSARSSSPDSRCSRSSAPRRSCEAGATGPTPHPTSSTACVVFTAPPEPFVPPELQGKPVLAIPALYVGDAERAGDVIEPLKALLPAVDLVAPMP